MKRRLLTLLLCGLTLCATARHIPQKAIHVRHSSYHSIFSVSALSISYLVLAPKEGHILIYPNPATVHISVKGEAQAATTIEIMNMIGAVVLHEDIANGVVSIADLPSGIYIVRVYGADGELSLSSKLTKQ